MESNNDVFEQTSEEQTSDSILDELVGEGKKFKTVDELAKGKLEADKFISNLTEENKDIRAKLDELATKVGDTTKVQTLLEELKAKEGNDPAPKNQEVDGESFEEKVKRVLEGDRQQATAKANREAGNKLVLDKFNGDSIKAKAYLAERATELGTTPAKLAELSEQSPQLFAKAVDANLSAKESSLSALHGSNTSSFSTNSPMEIDGVKTKAYFDKLKKEMGTSKFLNSKQVQNEYMRSAMKLGSKFKT